MKLPLIPFFALLITTSIPQSAQAMDIHSRALMLGIESYTFGKMSLTNLQNCEQILLKDLKESKKLSSKVIVPLIVSIGAGALFAFKLYVTQKILSNYYHNLPQYLIASSLSYIGGLLIGKCGNYLINKHQQNMQE